MDFAVLLKVVPPLDRLRFDPERKAMVRESAALLVNPFDARALRVALDVRRPGETVSAVSMGPPGADVALREALALGADRAILVSDRVLAGSDTLVTSRVLARALERTGHSVVLAGKWTTDSETGQVGPEVAALLGIPIVSALRSIARDSDGVGFEVVRDTETGWERLRTDAPVVFTVGEKITKIRKPTPAEVAAAATKTIESVSAEALGFSPSQVGFAGSPTIVESLRNEEPTRAGRRFDQGEVADRVREALAAVRPLAELGARPGEPLPALPVPLSDLTEVAVLVTGTAGTLDDSALPVLSEVRRRLAPLWPSAVWVGPPPNPSALRTLGRSGAGLVRVRGGPSEPLDTRGVALAFDELLDHRPHVQAAVFLADTFGREVAGQVAARRGLGLTGDAVGVRLAPDGAIFWDKPSFGGGIVASIRCTTSPSLATVRPGAFEPGRETTAILPALSTSEWGPPRNRVARLDAALEGESGAADLTTARVVVTAGMGVGGPQNLARLEATVRSWGAALGATRRIVDAGWLPFGRQVGLTGRSLAPALAVLIGVSGAVNHLVGLRRARAILAVNSDPNAPVFRGADAGIVGSWSDVLPELDRELGPFARQLSAARP